MNVATASRRAIAFLVPALVGVLALQTPAALSQATPLAADAAAQSAVTAAQRVAAAVTPLTVAQAIAQQGTTGATVRGYVVGQPTATSTVIRSGFTADTAIAIADSASTTATGSMLYVQITAAYRSTYGLVSNPSLLGTRIDVTGELTAYFAHPGLKSPTAITPAGSTSTPTPTVTPTSGTGTDAYYSAALGKTGNSLRSALHQIITTGDTQLTYDQVWNALKVTDQDPSNSSNVILLYSGLSRSKTLNGGDVGDWNREHVYAKSHGDFGTATGPGTDVHHLRPEDVTVNSIRNNKDFDSGGSAVSGATGNYTDSDSFEPRNAVKGDVARMIFYMAVRYEGDDGFADLEVNDSVTNGSAPYIGRLSKLKTWNTQDPPDAFEQRRNQVIYDQFQHNRNPFVDHPEWVASIF